MAEEKENSAMGMVDRGLKKMLGNDKEINAESKIDQYFGFFKKKNE
jgi:hypothetical protein